MNLSGDRVFILLSTLKQMWKFFKIKKHAKKKGAMHAWCRLGQQLMNRCRPEETGTIEYGKMMTTILELEEGRVPDRHEGEKKKSYQERVQKRFREESEVGRFSQRKKREWNTAKKEDAAGGTDLCLKAFGIQMPPSIILHSSLICHRSFPASRSSFSS